MTRYRAWRCGAFELPVFERVHLMGILNVTPDSFSDGGKFLDAEAAIEHALDLVEQGADLIDVGGESSRPGAEPVTADEEIDRVVPVIEALARKIAVPISTDTTKSKVALASIEAGASIVNDISAMRSDPGMKDVVAGSTVGLILMHMQGSPRTMQADPHYDDVVAEVGRMLAGRASEAIESGIDPDRIAVDPGIGFGKTREHNLQLLAHVDQMMPPGSDHLPIVVGPSRKTFIGTTLGLSLEAARAGNAPMEGTAAAVAWLASGRAQVLRVHDVAEMASVVAIIEAIRGS